MEIRETLKIKLTKILVSAEQQDQWDTLFHINDYIKDALPTNLRKDFQDEVALVPLMVLEGKKSEKGLKTLAINYVNNFMGFVSKNSVLDREILNSRFLEAISKN